MSHIRQPLRQGSRRGATRAAHSAALFLSLSAAIASAGAAIRQEAALRIEVTPLVVEEGATRSLEPLLVEATREKSGTLETSIDWPPAGSKLDLTLTVEVGEGGASDAHALRLSATVRAPGGPPVRASREMTLEEGSTGLFDVLDQPGRRLVLSLSVEEFQRPTVQGRRSTGTPVLFLLEIQRLDGPRSVVLETNRLVTFLREGVEYSFSSGGGDARESLRVVLTPLRLDGDLAEVEIDVSGSLPGAGQPLLLSRRERIVTSRGATSSVEVTAGEPPAGYRFRITPDF